MWWSFGSGLLTGWILITWTLWQCFDYSDCDSAADSYTFADCTALTWQSTVLVIMTGQGEGSRSARIGSRPNRCGDPTIRADLSRSTWIRSV